MLAWVMNLDFAASGEAAVVATTTRVVGIRRWRDYTAMFVGVSLCLTQLSLF